MTTVLRPYQKTVVREISDLYKSHDKPDDYGLGVMLQMSTGAGKTRTAGYIVDKYSSTGRQVLWLVHRDELLMQAAMTFAENGIRHRMVCSASSERAIKAEEFREFGRSYVDQNAMVVVASIQTIVRRVNRAAEAKAAGKVDARIDTLEWLNPSQIVADEAHLSLAATWRIVIGKWPKARLLGLTATPTREDKQSFARADGGLYDNLVEGPPPGDLIAWGNLAEYEVYGPPVHFKKGVKLKMKKGDFDGKSLEEEFDGPLIYGDVIGHYRQYSHGKPAIGFCPTVKVAQKFAQEFCNAGYRAIALDGETDDTVRRRALKQLATGEIDVIMSVDILIEGTDVPYATTCIFLRRTKSLRIYLQAVGRVLRPHPLKDRAIILDFVGVTHEHGYPDDDREWSLTGEVKRRRRAANDNGPDVRIMTCPQCFAIHPPEPQCPRCGHQYTAKERQDIKQVEGNLVHVTAEDRARQRAEKEAEKLRQQQARKREESQCVTLEDFEKLAEQRGYQYGKAWAKKRFELRSRRRNAA